MPFNVPANFKALSVYNLTTRIIDTNVRIAAITYFPRTGLFYGIQNTTAPYTLYSSRDCLNWTLVYTFPNATDVTYGLDSNNTVLVISGRNTTSTHGIVVTSTDGINFTYTDVGDQVWASCKSHDNENIYLSRFNSAGAHIYISKTTDGITFVNSPNYDTAGSTFYSLFEANNKFFAHCSAGALNNNAFSGNSFDTLTGMGVAKVTGCNGTFFVRSCAYGAGQWVITGSSNNAYITTDWVNFTNIVQPTFPPTLYGCNYLINPGVFIIFGSGTNNPVAYTSDGVNFNIAIAQAPASYNFWQAIETGNNVILTDCGLGTIVTGLSTALANI